MSLTIFRDKCVHIYKGVNSYTYTFTVVICAVAIRSLLSFSSTYMCESGFSPRYKDKHKNKLDREADLKCVICYKVTNQTFGFQKTVTSFLLKKFSYCSVQCN